MKKNIFFLFFSLLCLSEMLAQGYRIEVTVDGVQDTTLYMAIYSGTNKYAIDTAVTDSKGHAVFQKDKALHGGMYLIAMGGVQILDFLISDSLTQHFSIYTKTDDYYGALTFTGSPENTALLDFQANLQKEQKKINGLLERAKNDESQAQAVKDSIAIVEKAVQHYIEVNREKHKGTLLASILKAAFPPTAPDPGIPEGTPKRDSLLWAHYYQFNKNHYFDNIDFSDARLIYTPILKPRVEEYFSKTLIQVPDSLIPQVDFVLKLAGVNHEVYSTVFSQLFNKYVEADIMGMEKVAIYIGENYILTGKADWIEGEAKQKIKDFVEHNRHSLIGMQAKDLKLQSITGQFESIYDIASPYLVLVFYEPDCGHCRKQVPLIYEVYKKYKHKGVQVFAVCGEYKYDKWVKFVTEHNLDWINVWDGYNKQDDVSIGSHFREYYNVYSTPQVYLLDKDKKIIGRRLSADVLEQILEHELGEKKSNDK
jgi:peroxiredoxin